MFALLLIVTTIKAANIVWLGIKAGDWMLGLAAVPFWVWGNLLAGMVVSLVKSKERHWGLILLNLVVIVPLLILCTNWMMHGALLRVLPHLWLSR